MSSEKQNSENQDNEKQDREFNLALINDYEQALSNADGPLLHELMQTIDELMEMVYALESVEQ